MNLNKSADDAVNLTGFPLLFKNYLKKNKCADILTMLGKFSRVDYLINSGDSTVLIEHKRRYYNVCQFDSALIQKDKHDSIMSLSDIFDCPAFYVVEFNECYLIFQLKRNTVINWQVEEHYTDSSSTDKKIKVIGYLPFNQADYIISKKTWTNRPYSDLLYYTKVMRGEISI